MGETEPTAETVAQARAVLRDPLALMGLREKSVQWALSVLREYGASLDRPEYRAPRVRLGKRVLWDPRALRGPRGTRVRRPRPARRASQVRS